MLKTKFAFNLAFVFTMIFFQRLSANYFQSCTEIYIEAHERRALGFE